MVRLSKLDDFINAHRGDSDAEYLRHADKDTLLAYSASGWLADDELVALVERSQEIGLWVPDSMKAQAEEIKSRDNK